MTRIVIAPNAFKESISAPAAAAAIAQGVLRVIPDAEVVCVPVADGGDGTAESVLAAREGKWREVKVHDPLMRPIQSRYGTIDDGRVAVIEMAEASGLRLLAPDERNPMKTSTFGAGELLRDALDRGCETIIMGIGGSATVDGGLGMASALGYGLLDSAGNPIEANGGGLQMLAHIVSQNVHPQLRKTKILIASDVTNPLVGPEGAAAVFGPQKGATPDMVDALDAGLVNAARCWRDAFGVDVAELPGAGAAGGLGAGLVAFCGAEIRSGFDLVADTVKLDDALQGAQLVITGEGKIDEQTQYGKAPAGVAARAKRFGVPAVGLAGSLSGDLSALYTNGMTALFSIVPGPMSLDDAMANAKTLLADASEQVVRLWQNSN
ncbi:MAG: glycerate kinase [Candidatus Hinthialibacter antarcticus]|nr:glycerate kinase [Candidatus Hinthialibacter antarcticus]